jgi:hypothetical protein
VPIRAINLGFEDEPEIASPAVDFVRDVIRREDVLQVWTERIKREAWSFIKFVHVTRNLLITERASQTAFGEEAIEDVDRSMMYVMDAVMSVHAELIGQLYNSAFFAVTMELIRYTVTRAPINLTVARHKYGKLSPAQQRQYRERYSSPLTNEAFGLMLEGSAPAPAPRSNLGARLLNTNFRELPLSALRQFIDDLARAIRETNDEELIQRLTSLRIDAENYLHRQMTM